MLEEKASKLRGQLKTICINLRVERCSLFQKSVEGMLVVGREEEELASSTISEFR